MNKPEAAVRELRLALVCYGGVSLAIYMHGIAKEIQKLVIASAAYEQDQTINPFAPKSTERAWWDVLNQAAQKTGVRTRVVVDIVSGTSAGGINGVCLAKAIATNRSQDGLTKVWLEKGDLSLLVRGPSWMPVSLRTMGVAADILTRPRTARAPLGGNDMCKWLLDAFNDMDASQPALPGVKSLVPDGQSIDLFVPVTDFNGRPRQIPIDSPLWTGDRSFRHVMKFRHNGREKQFSVNYNGALAFASRATSSFPGGFPPISILEFEKATKNRAPVADRLREFFPAYAVDGLDARNTWFVDGGVLDNAPFATSIESIPSKPADTEVVRRLLYIEPDPSVAPAMEKTGSIPSVPATIWGGLAGIPRQEPIVDDLFKLARRNQDVRRVRDVIETSFTTIKQKVGKLLDTPKHVPKTITETQVNDLLDRACEEAATETGFGYATYVRLRVRSVVDGFGSILSQQAGYPSGSSQAAFVSDVIREWAVTSGLLEQKMTVTERQKHFIRDFDIAYYERQIRFMVSALSWWYGAENGPSRKQLDEGKRTLYGYIDELHGVLPQIVECPSVRGALETVFSRGAIKTAFEQQIPIKDIQHDFASTLEIMEKEVGALLDDCLQPILKRLHRDVVDMTAKWPANERDDFLVRYFGFPFWDVLTFPVQALSGVNERDGVTVVRLSPRDVSLIQPPDKTKPKLRGVGFHHFGAFFNRESRENDYLWGRLDAAERLVSLLIDDASTPGVAPAEPAMAFPLFQSVLAEESDRLTRVKPLMTALGIRLSAKNS